MDIAIENEKRRRARQRAREEEDCFRSDVSDEENQFDENEDANNRTGSQDPEDSEEDEEINVVED